MTEAQKKDYLAAVNRAAKTSSPTRSYSIKYGK